MNRRAAWRLLGIAPTGDQRAIRSAYAARLKAIDVDADPAAFIALREAFEAAQMEARWRVAPAGASDLDEPPDHDELVEPDGPEIDMAPPEPSGDAQAEANRHAASPDAPEAPPPSGPWQPITPAEVNAQVQALVDLLQGLIEAQRLPDQGEQARMLGYWQAITSDPRMQQVAFYADAQNWTSDLIARTIPVSDSLIDRAIVFFGWMNSAGSISQSPAAAYLVRRQQLLGFVATVSDPKHRLGKAWRELTTPATADYDRGRVNASTVRELLMIVRRDYPELERERFDAVRVASWEPLDPASGSVGGFPIGWLVWIAIIIAVNALNFCSKALQTNTPPHISSDGPTGDRAPALLPPLPRVEGPDMKLSSATPDIDAALGALFGEDLDIATIAAENQQLNQALLRRWDLAKTIGETREKFLSTVSELLDDRYVRGVRQGDLGLISDFHQLTIEMATVLEGVSGKACTDFLDGPRRWDPRMPTNLQRREKALMIRVLLETHLDPLIVDKRTRYDNPTLLPQAAAMTGMTEHALTQALDGKADDSQTCRARTAYLTVAIEPGNADLNTLRGL